MLKGCAEIELRDKHTGETKRIKHENMLTDGLAIALTPQLGRYAYTTGYKGGSGAPETDENKMKNNRSVMDHLLGGLFLFGETLQESAGNVEMPAGGALIGKGGHNAYSGVDAQRGSYNEKESGVQADGSFRHVWDFATSQANGTIRALALTTHAGGIEGDGTAGWNSAQTGEEAPLYLMLDGGTGNTNGAYVKHPDSMSGSCFLFASYAKNRIYAVKNKYEAAYNGSGGNPAIYYKNSGKLHVMEYGVPLSKISPFYDGYNLYREQEHEIEVPAAFTAQAGNQNPELVSAVSGSYVYLYMNGIQHKKGADIKLLRLDKNTLEASVVSFPNVSGSDIYLSYITHGAPKTLFLTDTHAFLAAQEKGEDGIYRTWLYRVSLSDGTDAARVELADPDGGSTTNTFVFFGTRGNHIAMGYQLSSSYNNSIFAPLLLDPQALKVKYLNMRNANINSNSICHYEKLSAGLYLYAGSSVTGNFNFIPAIDPCMLMTVNNLSAPVEKTAAQSMKVTYTITET